jgi:hypothetical protein
VGRQARQLYRKDRSLLLDFRVYRPLVHSGVLNSWSWPSQYQVVCEKGNNSKEGNGQARIKSRHALLLLFRLVAAVEEEEKVAGPTATTGTALTPLCHIHVSREGFSPRSQISSESLWYRRRSIAISIHISISIRRHGVRGLLQLKTVLLYDHR